MTIVTKIVDVFNIFVQAANLGLWIYIGLQATKAAQVWPVKLLKQRAFASVNILQLKCVRSISRHWTSHQLSIGWSRKWEKNNWLYVMTVIIEQRHINTRQFFRMKTTVDTHGLIRLAAKTQHDLFQWMILSCPSQPDYADYGNNKTYTTS